MPRKLPVLHQMPDQETLAEKQKPVSGISKQKIATMD